MVKRFFAALLLALLLPLCAFAARPVVVDDANLFSAEEKQRIAAKAQEVIDRYQVDIVIVTSYAPKAERSQEFADDYFDYNGYGIGEDGAGLLYLIDMTNRVPTISTKGVMIDYITDHRLNELFDCSYDALRAGQYGRSTLQLLNRLEQFMAQGREEGSFRYDAQTGERLSGLYNTLTKSELLAAVFAGLAVAGLIVLVVYRKYQLRGSTYHFDASTQVKMDNDSCDERYLRQTIIHHNTESGGGSGGGGGGMGSSVHTSSSGSFHGGGSGRGF